MADFYYVGAFNLNNAVFAIFGIKSMVKLDYELAKEKIVKQYYNKGEVDPNLSKKVKIINLRETSDREFKSLGYREEAYCVQIQS